MLDEQCQQALVPGGPLRPPGAPGAVQALRLGLRRTVTATIDREAGASARRAGRGKAHALGGGGGQEAGECRPPRVVARMQGTPARVVVAMPGLQGRGDAPSERCMLKNMRDEGARVIDAAQPVEPQGCDRMAGGHQAPGRCPRCS